MAKLMRQVASLPKGHGTALAAVGGERGGERFFRLGADAEVCVGLGEEDLPLS